MARFIWGYKAFCFIFTGSAHWVDLKIKSVGQIAYIAQSKSFLFCGRWVSGPLWKPGLLDSFERALKCPRCGWLQGPLTGDTAVNFECFLPSAWEEQSGQSEKKKALVRIAQKLKADVNTSVLTDSCVFGIPSSGPDGCRREGCQVCCGRDQMDAVWSLSFLPEIFLSRHLTQQKL